MEGSCTVPMIAILFSSAGEEYRTLNQVLSFDHLWDCNFICMYINKILNKDGQLERRKEGRAWI